MPAWGTVTTSPACSWILLRVSPVSRRSFKLIVIEVDSGFAGAAAVSAPGEAAGGLACANSSADGKDCVFGEASAGSSGTDCAAGGSSGGGSPEPGAAAPEFVCGLAASPRLKIPWRG